MGTTYEVNIERRNGQLVAELVQTVTTVPTSGRGKEWSKSTEEVHVYTFPTRDLDNITAALTNGLIFAAEEGITDRGDEPEYALYDPTFPDEPELFWSTWAAYDYVREARNAGKDTSQWVLRHVEKDDPFSFIRTF